ncbi:MAG TPA: hypothetical protein VNZ03_12055 [Terriglobales bacterium]|jgi:hypothetical protein|nr:hypothetical protein [Terriglobales bacterium]
MSQERRKKQQDRLGVKETKPVPRSIIVAVLIVAVFGAVYFFIRHRQTSRLDAFAKCLTTKQAKMYGAFWCPHCEEQKEKFGSSFQYAPYIECGIKGSQAIAPVCTQAGIKRFPTWIFADGTRVEGEHELDFLGEQTGCNLP